MPPNEDAVAQDTPTERNARLTFKQRMEVANWLNDKFKFERYIYLFLTTASVTAVVGLAVFWLSVGRQDWQTFSALFAPAGLVTFAQGRVLHVWNKTRDILMGAGMAAGQSAASE